MSTGYVLDSWALLALYKSAEPAATQVRTRLRTAIEQNTLVTLSVINLGEIFYIIGRERGVDAAQTIVQQIQESSIQILPVDKDFVLDAAQYKMTYPISYADAFAVAAAVQTKATLLTGDPELINLQHVINIELLQRS